MKSDYLLPNKFKLLGWILFVIGLISGTILVFYGYDSFNLEPFRFTVLSVFEENYLGGEKNKYFKIINTGIANELVIIAIVIGGLIVGFSKEKIEDEFIYKLRKDSLVWAFIINYIILIITTVFIYDLTFFHVLVFNMFTPLIIFIIRFNFLKLKSNSDEE